MAKLDILNSSLTTTITLQSWPYDTFLPFLQGLIRMGFTINPSRTLSTLAYKKTTTNIAVDYTYRRVSIQIGNNKSTPQENVNEIFSVLSEIGYSPQESIERVDILGYVTIKVHDDLASTFVPSVIGSKFIEKSAKILGQSIRPIGIRISSIEPLYTGNISRSPFLFLIEPLLTDPSDTKFLVNVIYASNSADHVIHFLEGLYSGLMNTIMEFKNG
jgi:hypothetical protein